MIRVLVNGFRGRMGTQVVQAVVGADDMEVVGGVEHTLDKARPTVTLDGTSLAPAFDCLARAIDEAAPDVIVDFTLPTVVEGNLRVALARGIDCVVGTTGLSPQKLDELIALAPASTTLFVAPNFTTGAVLMTAFAKLAARYFPDAEVIEFHHNGKADAPSGTAANTARAIAQAQRDAGIVRSSPGRETELAGFEGARGAAVDGVPVHAVRSNGFVAHQEVIFGSPGQTLTIRHDSIDRASYMPGVLLAIRSVKERSGLIVGLDKLMGL
ncbi:MAG: 4-hydroxy-tetrahydrodipicolinate reductase [Coriobacteriales bacterium]|jgi:4-hydroxy-tetrahydrodipicolinate reductase|nr:4-hydroxy-tetrahydrodipicolinate reductase [Coriobacteriales bacterium]